VQLDSGLKRFFICGSALQSQPDHKNIQSAKFIKEASTRPRYKMHSVGNGAHPGIYEIESGGIAIPGEVYTLSLQQYKNLITEKPADFYEGKIVLEDGEVISAILYPRELVEKHNWLDISHYGGWAAYKQAEAEKQ
jgi:gamma-glutamylaminecyclotransferase